MQLIYRAKEGVLRLFHDDQVYFSGVLLLVSVVAFGLGRFSGGEPVISAPAPPQPEAAAVRAAPEVKSATAVATSSLTSQKAYVASKNSTKYHLPWCSGAQRIAEANKVWFATKEEVEATGRTPASNCPGI